MEGFQNKLRVFATLCCFICGPTQVLNYTRDVKTLHNMVKREVRRATGGDSAKDPEVSKCGGSRLPHWYLAFWMEYLDSV